MGLPQAAGIDRAHLLNEDASWLTCDFDLGPEGCRLSAGRGGRNEHGGETQQLVSLNHHAVSGARLLMAPSVAGGAKAIDLTSLHAIAP